MNSHSTSAMLHILVASILRHMLNYKTNRKFQCWWCHQEGLAEELLHLPGQHPHAQPQCPRGGQGPPGCCWGWVLIARPSPASKQPYDMFSPATASGFARLLPYKDKSSNHFSRQPLAGVQNTISRDDGSEGSIQLERIAPPPVLLSMDNALHRFLHLE